MESAQRIELLRRLSGVKPDREAMLREAERLGARMDSEAMDARAMDAMEDALLRGDPTQAGIFERAFGKRFRLRGERLQAFYAKLFSQMDTPKIFRGDDTDREWDMGDKGTNSVG